MIIDLSSADTQDLDKELQDFLEHFGVKGMHWGVRNKAKPSARNLNKISRAKDRQEHADAVQKAREHFSSGQARIDYKTAKAQYKKDKITMGSREARKIFNKTKQNNLQQYEKSQEAKNGKEVAVIMLGVIGAAVVGSALSSR